MENKVIYKMQMCNDKHMEAFCLWTMTSSSRMLLCFLHCSVICHNETESQSVASMLCRWHSLTQVSSLAFYKLPLQSNSHHLYAMGRRWVSCDINPTIFLLSHFRFYEQVWFSLQGQGLYLIRKANSSKNNVLLFLLSAQESSLTV